MGHWSQGPLQAMPHREQHQRLPPTSSFDRAPQPPTLVTLPPISCLLASLAQDHPPPLLGSQHWGQTGPSSNPYPTPTSSVGPSRTTPAAFSPSTTAIPHSPETRTARASANDSVRSNYSVVRRPIASLPANLAGVAAPRPTPSGLVGAGRPLSPRSSSSYISSRPSSDPFSSTFDRRSTSLSMRPYAAPMSHSPSLDDDRTPTFEHPFFQTSSNPPSVRDPTINPSEERRRGHDFDSAGPSRSLASRKRPEPLYGPDFERPPQKAPFGRMRSASISSSEESVTIPAWSDVEAGGLVSSAGSSPRTLNSPLDTSEAFGVPRGAVESGGSLGAFVPSIVDARGSTSSQWPTRSPEQNAIPFRNRSTPDLSSLEIGSGSRRGSPPGRLPCPAPSTTSVAGPSHATATATSQAAWFGPAGDQSQTGDDANNDGGRYLCPHCTKRFARPSSLRIHIHSHTGEKPFDCNLCGRGFSVQSNLKRHLKIHQAKGKGGRTEKSSADEGEGSLGSEEESGQR